MALTFLNLILSFRFSIPIIIAISIISRAFNEYASLVFLGFSIFLIPLVMIVLIVEKKYIWLFSFILVVFGGSLLSYYLYFINQISFRTSLFISATLFFAFYLMLKFMINSLTLNYSKNILSKLD